MIARAVCALLALAALPARAQDADLYVEVSPTTDDPVVEDVEKRYTPELVEELQSAKDDALLLYTEFTGRAGLELRLFLREMHGFANKTIGSMDDRILVKAPESCKNELDKRLRKIQHDAQQHARFSGVNHHKFLLGHMVVFRMHLNKSEDFIKKCDNVVRTCGINCETTPRVKRWRRHAADELNRVKDDLQHSRRSYRDILTHAHRHLRHLRKESTKKAKEAIDEFMKCV